MTFVPTFCPRCSNRLRRLWRRLRRIGHTHETVWGREWMDEDGVLATYRCRRCGKYESVVVERLGPHSWRPVLPRGWRWADYG